MYIISTFAFFFALLLFFLFPLPYRYELSQCSVKSMCLCGWDWSRPGNPYIILPLLPQVDGQSLANMCVCMYIGIH